MPEDLRSKESGVLSKMKSKYDFDFDFVSPDDSSIKKSSSKSSFSFFDKIKKIFNKSASFSQEKTDDKDLKKSKKPTDNQQDKIVGDYSPQKHKTASVMHMPEKEESSSHYSVDYKNKFSDIKQPELEYEYKPVSSQGFTSTEHKDDLVEEEGESWWDKIKAWFKFEKKEKAAPKMELVPPKPVMPKSDIGKVEDKPVSDKKNQLEDILDEKNIPQLKNVSNNFGQDFAKTPEPKQEMPTPPKPEVTNMEKVEDKKVSDFAIPSLVDKKEIPQAPQPEPEQDDNEEEKPSKFHTPDSRIRARFLGEGGGVDLIPDAVKVRSWRQVVILLSITIFGSIFIIGSIYGFLFYQNQKLQKQRDAEFDQITNLERQIVDYKELNDEISQLGDKIKRIHKLLSLHFYWTNFFQLLEKYTIDGVYYAGIQAGNGGAMTLEARADSFETLAKQIKILQQDEAREFVSDVDVGSAQIGAGQKEVSFSMTLVLNPSLFLYDENYLYEIENSSFFEGEDGQ